MNKSWLKDQNGCLCFVFVYQFNRVKTLSKHVHCLFKSKIISSKRKLKHYSRRKAKKNVKNGKNLLNTLEIIVYHFKKYLRKKYRVIYNNIMEQIRLVYFFWGGFCLYFFWPWNETRPALVGKKKKAVELQYRQKDHTKSIVSPVQGFLAVRFMARRGL